MVFTTSSKLHCAIKYTPKQSLKQFADEVSDARRGGDLMMIKKIETKKIHGNSAYGKCISNKENFWSSTEYGNEDNISKEKGIVHLKDVALL